MHPFLYLTIVSLYVLLMLGVGYWCMRRTKSVGDFLLGGRTLGPWMSAFAYGTTYFSAVLFIGHAGKLGWGFGIYTIPDYRDVLSSNLLSYQDRFPPGNREAAHQADAPTGRVEPEHDVLSA